MELDLKLAFRESREATRPYVIINPLLAKHLPVKPSQALDYFSLLGGRVAEACTGESVLVIGFAETATAVGAAVAAVIENAVYVHTTRENLPSDKLVAGFKEEHSHAKDQALYLREEYRDLSQFDRIVFVEDEITTGKTILNFLANVKWTGKIIVSALVFNDFDEAVFSKYDGIFICLQRTSGFRAIEINGYINPRTGVNIKEYMECCRSLAARIKASIETRDIIDKDILVIGTEEFMYPALYLGRELESAAGNVKTHSTTRSPLSPGTADRYPLKTRDSFASVYDCKRTTYLYNLAKYDTVIMVTDSGESDYSELLQVLLSYGNQRIYSVRLRNDQ